jgi:hypothetical protein
MTLFASLSKTEAFSDLQDSSKHAPAYPTTAVQLYGSRYIDFRSNSILSTDRDNLKSSKSKHQRKAYEPLTYQAIQVQDMSIIDDIKQQDHSHPNLGIWDCQIQSNNTDLSTQILKSVLRGTNPTFILVLNLDDPPSVYPHLVAMIDTIIGYCYANHQQHQQNSSESCANEGGTTDLFSLQSIPFGKAPLNQEDVNNDTPETFKDIPNRHLKIVICGILSKYSSKDATYKEKQAMNLLSYHLQKYASDINCYLCFVNSPQDDDREGNDDNEEQDSERFEGRSDALRPKGMPVQELCQVLKSICTGLSSSKGKESIDNGVAVVDDDVILKEDNDMGKDPNDDEKTAIYSPFEYDVDLINSVLLRGAGCPGVWNANTDDLCVALPPTSISKKEVSAKDASVSVNEKRIGDEEWLHKLADSVSSYIGSVGGTDASSILSPTTSTLASASNNGTPKVSKKKVVKKKSSGDKGDVQDFFASLINK